MKKMDKNFSIMIHCHKRFKERFGISFNRRLRDKIISQILSGEAKLLLHQSRARSLWEIKIQDKTIWIIYDRLRERILTCLHPDEELLKTGRDEWSL